MKMDKMPMPQHSFFKFMLDDFTHQFHIPPNFVLHYNDILPGNLLLENSRGECWDVKLKKKKNEFFLCKGWTVFVQDNSIKFGDFLVFRSLGGSKFNVRIYGKDCCEKEGISKRRSTDQCMPCKRKENHRNVYVGLAEEDQYQVVEGEKEREDEVSHQILGEDWCKTGASPRKEVFNKGKELATCIPKKNMSSTRSSFRPKSNNLSKSKLRSNDACRIKTKDNRRVCCIGQSSLKRSRITLNKLKKRKIKRGIIPVADWKEMDRDEGNEGGKFCMNSDVEVETSVDAYSTDEEVILITSKFSKSTENEDIELSCSQDAESTDEVFELSSNKDAESVDEEVQSHGFEQGNLDSLHHGYQKAESSPRLSTKDLNLFGRKRKPATLQETGRSNAARGFKSRYPFFTVRLVGSYLNEGYMYIPLDFANTYLPKESANVCILDSSERAWHAQYSYKRYFRKWKRCRAYLSKGWKALVVANKLREGNVCAFELIEEENIKLKLSILKKGC